ncbi:GNAT domain-containing protein [Cercophora newfieldiana]|uniref:GNAT domain-containing protein n=1 Tax=Cercophora newfieldiana TaxID=92897 RepID=A0AA40CLC9_9PEZI|nr:GNAT domain-containing protein [Cercophora newfieldiana]
MQNNPQGRPDTSPEETLPRLNAFLEPNDATTYNFAICLRDTEEMIGLGGCHRLDSLFGWPVVGYQLRKEYWGRGLATEFLRAWLGAWCKLPRGEVERRVHPGSVVEVPGEGGRVEEVISSWALIDNVASQRVLEKGGLELFLVQREADLRDKDKEVELRVYRYFPGRQGR